jgi:hypothetical protein
MSSDQRFLLQTGPVLSIEKYACRLSGYKYLECHYDSIGQISERNYIPVGSTEFVGRYCKCIGLQLPSESITYLEEIRPFIKRSVRRGVFGDAGDDEFVKPVSVKCFTGGLKKNLNGIPQDTPVWISDPVNFGSEFRFYINRSAIIGWARYDNLECVNPTPDPELVKTISKEVEKNSKIVAFSIDIGWRFDLNCYDLVELNDAWSLGYYNNSDPQSSPPTAKNYADMLISRWSQLCYIS